MSSIHLVALPGAVRVGPTGAFQGEGTAEVACARNEVGSFQVVVTAMGGHLQQVEAEVSALRAEKGGEVPAGRITLYREVFVPVRYSSPRATLPPDFYPDPLVPFVNPYTGEPIRGPQWREGKLAGARFGGGGFDLWEGHHQPLWVDIAVPEGTPPGAYTGVIRVRARNADPAEMPIALTVWDFALPDGPTHENHFGGFRSVARYHKLDPGSGQFRLLEDRYIEAMAGHRLNPPLPTRLHPGVGEDGGIQVDEALGRDLTAFVGRYHLTNIEIPRAPFKDALGADREKAIRFYRTWHAYLEKKGWAKGAYLYMLDEPNDPEAYERVRRLGALVREAAPRIRRLVVEQTYAQDPAWGVLDGAVDIWCPLFAFIHEPDVKRVQRQGDEVWSYTALVQAAPRYHPDYEAVKDDHPPYWQADFPALSYRIAPWLNRRYGITGLLYWSTVHWFSPDRNPWDDPGFRIRWNGDGFLFYPGDDAGIEGPITSIRLKYLRDGMQDYEYFAILEGRGGKGVVEEVVRDAVPTWGAWNQDPYHLLRLRRRLAEEIVRR
ncbi:MAG: hypothetical protein A3F84_02700 [Candidatus Handelsmanbacteria bacterium RIFCSPLOWO2_12_FULL_64_10]|uniref:Uncharacterized protein n=1 Tax=Handelsmanbacteria sp. (strain RIFCSPLOWO2_12_FULL_64_10) TaxID=1817868 RepID=A0A1F6CWR4_HANXR|nr:MAG: hypothetical protein A3F84_02700 [Candidatus Handelsmanbacteria bacterium RIFCSPLOWO2_12_FULL_64_10]